LNIFSHVAQTFKTCHPSVLAVSVSQASYRPNVCTPSVIVCCGVTTQATAVLT